MTNHLSNIAFIGPLAVLVALPACSASEDGPAPSDGAMVATGTGAMGDGTADNSTQASSAGTAQVGTGNGGSGVAVASDGMDALVSGGAAGTQNGGGNTALGGAGNTGGSGGSGLEGVMAEMGGSASEGTAGAASGSGGASGANGAMDGMGGSGGAMGAMGGSGGASGGSGGAMGEPEVVTRPPVEVEGTVPSQYGNPVANGGEWTRHTYPVYYYTASNSGASPGDDLEKQDSPLMKECNVYSPPGYDPEVEYPLIVVMHGITDNHNTWMERGEPKPDVLLDNLITSEVIEPVIAVFAQGDSSGDWASNDSYSNTAGYMVFGHELMNDLLPYVEANYSVKKDRNYRAFSGFSFGGMQTINVALSHYLEHFSWFGAFAAAGGNFGASQIAQNLEAQDVASYPLNHFYAMRGRSDGTAADVNRLGQDLPGAIPALTSENVTTHEVDGSHNYPTVTKGLYNFLRIAFGI